MRWDLRPPVSRQNDFPGLSVNCAQDECHKMSFKCVHEDGAAERRHRDLHGDIAKSRTFLPSYLCTHPCPHKKDDKDESYGYQSDLWRRKESRGGSRREKVGSSESRGKRMNSPTFLQPNPHFSSVAPLLMHTSTKPLIWAPAGIKGLAWNRSRRLWRREQNVLHSSSKSCPCSFPLGAEKSIGSGSEEAWGFVIWLPKLSPLLPSLHSLLSPVED